jgi:hypothetical protein
MYSRQCTGFLISSRFSQIRRAVGLQVPQRVIHHPILGGTFSLADGGYHISNRKSR